MSDDDGTTAGATYSVALCSAFATPEAARAADPEMHVHPYLGRLVMPTPEHPVVYVFSDQPGRWFLDHGFRDPRDRGQDSSRELIEVRTTLARAETALAVLRRCKARETQHAADPDRDIDQMIDVLISMVDRLEPWRRTGRTIR